MIKTILKLFCQGERSRNLFILVLIFINYSCKQEPENIKISGPIFGTTYSVIYDSKVNYQKQIDSLFYVINKSMSTYMENSDISKLNRNVSGEVDNHFKKVLEASQEIYKQTKGVFDPTIGVVVNAWDFGPEGEIKELDSLKIDSLMKFVGLDKIQ